MLNSAVMRKVIRTRSERVPVTKKMLFEVRDELKSLVNSRSHALESKIEGLRSDFKADVHTMKADMHAMKADIHGMKADVHAIKLLVEEQNARNRIVLDGLGIYFERTERLEGRMDSIERLYPAKKS